MRVPVPFMIIFLHNVDSFVWIYYTCLINMVFSLDPSNPVIKRLWCIRNIFYFYLRSQYLPELRDSVHRVFWSALEHSAVPPMLPLSLLSSPQSVICAIKFSSENHSSLALQHLPYDAVFWSFVTTVPIQSFFKIYISITDETNLSKIARLIICFQLCECVQCFQGLSLSEPIHTRI